MLIGLDMLQAKRSPTQEALGDTEEAAAKEDAGIVPLGIPMLAGPGAISSVMVLAGQVPHLWHWEMGAILGSIALTSLISYWVLAGAGRVRQVMGETGIRILVRIMAVSYTHLDVYKRQLPHCCQCDHSPPTACRHTVSGTLHSPRRGSFRLSLTVLVHYRSETSI